jgi:glutathione peroxidase-family protein
MADNRALRTLLLKKYTYAVVLIINSHVSCILHAFTPNYSQIHIIINIVNS